jgi:hypothetical protein
MLDEVSDFAHGDVEFSKQLCIGRRQIAICGGMGKQARLNRSQ